jgi:hypothetical protein
MRGYSDNGRAVGYQYIDGRRRMDRVKVPMYHRKGWLLRQLELELELDFERFIESAYE